MKLVIYSFLMFLGCSFVYSIPHQAIAADGDTDTRTQHRWYVGGSIGQADYDFTGIDKESGFKAFVGYNVHKNFAVEAAFIDSSDFSMSGPGGYADFDVYGLETSIVGKLPLGKNFTLFGKIGLFFWTADVTGVVPAVGLNGTVTDDGTDPAIGIGFEFKFPKSNWYIRAEHQKFDDVSGLDLSMTTIGISYGFGAR